MNHFSGFKGKCAFAQIGNVKFAVLAANARHLTVLWSDIMPGVPLDESGIKSAILIQPSDLPSSPTPAVPHATAHSPTPAPPRAPAHSPTPTALPHSAQGCAPRATLGTRPESPSNPERVASPILDV